jgi:DSF synthase
MIVFVTGQPEGITMQAIAPARFSPPNFSQIETRFDSEYGVLWGFMNPKPRPTFNTLLLSEAREFARNISDSGGVLLDRGQEHAINYVIEASKVPGVYNLGGDLALFRDAIARQDRELLLSYGRACIDNVFGWATCFGLPLTTIALVEGDAMGGGFESALSASVLIAEESARLGFPEILFNLFPGMGAYSLLSRKVGRRLTEEMINSGNLYTGRQLYDMGVVDVVAPDGAGEAAVYSYIKKHAKAANGRRAVEAARREVTPLSYDELSRVVTVWVDAALRLTERDVRMMERLVRAQNRNADLEVVSSNVTLLQRTA